MPKFEIWIEGHLCTGMGGIPSPARYEGTFEAETFDGACVAWSKTLDQPEYFNKENLSYWACRLFDNEADARKSFR